MQHCTRRSQVFSQCSVELFLEKKMNGRIGIQPYLAILLTEQVTASSKTLVQYIQSVLSIKQSR